MLRFFRQIRQRLFLEGKVSRYIGYAIGEIVLIVVGIFIGLQLNDWNERRKLATLEKELTTKLLAELTDNIEYNKRILKRIGLQIQLTEQVLSDGESFDSAAFLDESYKLDLQGLRRNLTIPQFLTDAIISYNPNSEIYNTATSDGSISLISDGDLVSRLKQNYVTTPGRVEDLHEKDFSVMEFMRNHIAIYYRNIFDALRLEEGIWDDDSSIRVLDEIRQDGTMKLLLQKKLQLTKAYQARIINTAVDPTEEFLITRNLLPEQAE